MLSPLCLNASHASWGCAEYRLRMPDVAAYVPPPHTEPHQHSGVTFSGLNLRAEPHPYRLSMSWVCLFDSSSSQTQNLLRNDDTRHLLLSLSTQSFREATTKEFLTQPIAVHRGHCARARTFAHGEPGCNALPLPKHDAFRAAL